MDFANAPFNAQGKIKSVLTPMWDREMGRRLKIAREKMLRTQAELATLMTTEGRPISQQQVASVESGRLDYLKITWARIDAIFGRHAAYVLIGRDKVSYNESLIARRYFEHRQKTLRKNSNPQIKSRHATPRGSRKWRTVW